MDVIWDMVRQYGITKVRWVCTGGATYQDSVLNGLHNLEPHCQDDDIVLIHFGVSPFVDQEIIDDSIAVCRAHGNAISSNPCVLCMCAKDPEDASRSTEGLDRETLMGLNSPQSFRMDYLRELYAEGLEKNVMDTLVDPDVYKRQAYEQMDHTPHDRPQILIGPSWQKDNIMDSCIDPLLEQLLHRGYRVILRPHPEWLKRYPQKAEAFACLLYTSGTGYSGIYPRPGRTSTGSR